MSGQPVPEALHKIFNIVREVLAGLQATVGELVDNQTIMLDALGNLG